MHVLSRASEVYSETSTSNWQNNTLGSASNCLHTASHSTSRSTLLQWVMANVLIRMLFSVMLLNRVAPSTYTLGWCQELGLKGECVELSPCVCLCYTVTADGTSVEAAYFGELGYELLLYSPSIYYLHGLGTLRKTIGPVGSAAFSYFSPNHTELDSLHRRFCLGTYVHRQMHLEHFNYNSWQPAPYKTHYRNTELRFEKPLVIIHNKYAMEWGGPPANFIDIPTLMQLAALLKAKYTIVYIRPVPHAKGYSEDDNQILHFNDHEELQQQHPEVLAFHELLHRFPDYSYNKLQLMLHANCDHFISVQGGSSILASHFAGTNVIFAVKGGETQHTMEYRELYPRLTLDPEHAIIRHVKTNADLVAFVKQSY